MFKQFCEKKDSEEEYLMARIYSESAALRECLAKIMDALGIMEEAKTKCDDVNDEDDCDDKII